MKYRKKPVVIDAFIWDGNRETLARNIGHFSSNAGFVSEAKVTDSGLMFTGKLKIPTLEGEMLADVGDWIIRGVKGEFYPCKPDIFEATYEAAE